MPLKEVKGVLEVKRHIIHPYGNMTRWRPSLGLGSSFSRMKIPSQTSSQVSLAAWPGHKVLVVKVLE